MTRMDRIDKVTIIVPTYNEADSLPTLVRGIREFVPDADIIIADDNSPDGTAGLAGGLGCQAIVRMYDRGLAQSVICALRYVPPSNIVVIMDADGQHAPHDLPDMLQAIEDGYDLAIGSRYVPGGSTPDWSPYRKRMSHFGCILMQMFTGIHDMNSGFTAFRRSMIDPDDMYPGSWHLLFELYSKGKVKRYKEVPITFRERNAGGSKFSLIQVFKGLSHFARMTSYTLAHPVGRSR